jgi:hypothetical protein
MSWTLGFFFSFFFFFLILLLMIRIRGDTKHLQSKDNGESEFAAQPRRNRATRKLPYST